MSAETEWTRATVEGLRDLTPTIREITLRLPMAVACAPGSHLRVGIAVDGRADVRSYSVVDHDRSVVRIAVKRQPVSRGGSAYMWSLHVGDTIRVAAPRCDFPLTHGASHYLLIAGGVGITPMVAIANTLATNGASLRLVYAARSADEFAYRDDLVARLGSRVAFVDASRGQDIDIAGEIAALPDDAELYMCGPLGMMDAVRASWAAAGRNPIRLRYETFGSSGQFQAQPFTVRVPRLGLDVPVAADQSMLDALEQAGVEVAYECRRGECGLCAVTVVDVDGTIDHRDVFLSDRQHRAGDRLCACVSRVAGGSITIDPAWRGDGAFFPTPPAQAASH
ncbi:PDR/VanB family oxidoreductase [Sphingomonas zeae]